MTHYKMAFREAEIAPSIDWFLGDCDHDFLCVGFRLLTTHSFEYLCVGALYIKKEGNGISNVDGI